MKQLYEKQHSPNPFAETSEARAQLHRTWSGNLTAQLRFQPYLRTRFQNTLWYDNKLLDAVTHVVLQSLLICDTMPRPTVRLQRPRSLCCRYLVFMIVVTGIIFWQLCSTFVAWPVGNRALIRRNFESRSMEWDVDEQKPWERNHPNVWDDRMRELPVRYVFGIPHAGSIKSCNCERRLHMSLDSRKLSAKAPCPKQQVPMQTQLLLSYVMGMNEQLCRQLWNQPTWHKLSIRSPSNFVSDSTSLTRTEVEEPRVGHTSHMPNTMDSFSWENSRTRQSQPSSTDSRHIQNA